MALTRFLITCCDPVIAHRSESVIHEATMIAAIDVVALVGTLIKWDAVFATAFDDLVVVVVVVVVRGDDERRRCGHPR